MGDMREDFYALKEFLNNEHIERVSKTPNRVEYAIEQFKKNNIKYELKNADIGHFHCWRVSDGRLFQFWAGTGKVQGYNNRGIHNLIKELLKEVKDSKSDVSKVFEKNGIKYDLKNESTGHFHCFRKSDGKLFQFWSSTGKILGYEEKGVEFLVGELLR